MKYPAKTYARAFAEVAARTPREKEGVIIKNFLAVVRKNGDVRQVGKIAELAEKLLMKKIGRSRWTIESARPLKNARETFKNLVKAADTLKEKVSPETIAGVKIVRDDERQYDGTLGAKLERLLS